MPELIEVEQYRRALDPLVGSSVHAIEILHPSFVRPSGVPAEIFDAAVGGILRSTQRIGKLLVLDILHSEAEIEIGLRFGMTGRLLVDGVSPIDKLEYASSRDEPSWDRVAIDIGGSRVSLRDQRRLGSIEFDPDRSLLGTDATAVSGSILMGAARSRTKSVKGVLLDQAIIAGLGNLLVDESLWRAGFDPRRSIASFETDAADALAMEIRSTVKELGRRGGSHTGDSFQLRAAGSVCSMCGGVMQSDPVAGRTTWWCPEHQE